MELYEARMSASGTTKRAMYVNRTKAAIRRKIIESPACHDVLINGVSQQVEIRHRAEMNIKRICALPGEHLAHGGIVDFADNKWLITEVDADNEVYERGMMKQCNFLLKWIDSAGKLIEKWIIIEDGTKYLVGEKAKEFMTIGDARISMTVGKDSDTIKLCRGLRFLVDDTDSDDLLAYEITKPNKLFNIYNGEGCFRFILSEVNVTKNDNLTLRIADYYNWHPARETDGDHVDTDETIAEIVSIATEEATTPVSSESGWL